MTQDTASHILFAALALGGLVWGIGQTVRKYRLAKIVVKEGLASSVFFGMSGTAWLHVTSSEGRRLRDLSILWALGGLFVMVVVGSATSIFLSALVHQHD